MTALLHWEKPNIQLTTGTVGVKFYRSYSTLQLGMTMWTSSDSLDIKESDTCDLQATTGDHSWLLWPSAFTLKFGLWVQRQLDLSLRRRTPEVIEQAEWRIWSCEYLHPKPRNHLPIIGKEITNFLCYLSYCQSKSPLCNSKLTEELIGSTFLGWHSPMCSFSVVSVILSFG